MMRKCYTGTPTSHPVLNVNVEMYKEIKSTYMKDPLHYHYLCA